MSVINQALNAIDQMPGATSAGADGLPHSPAKRPSSHRRLAILVLAGGAAIAAVAAGDMGALNRFAGGGAAVATPPTFRPAAMSPSTATAAPVPEPAVAAPVAGPTLAVANAAAAAVMPAAAPAAPAAAPAAPVAAPAAAPVAVAAPVLAPVAAPVAARATAAVPSTPTAAAPARELAPELHAAATLSVPAPIATPARIERRAAASTLPLPAGTRLWAKAVEQTNTGQRQAALLSLTELLQLEPSHHQGRHLAAVLEHESGATARAMALLAEGLTLDPRQADMAQLLARLQANQGQQDAALATLDRAAATGADADGLRAGILSQRGQFRDALPAYERALRGQPGNATWWAGLGVALESLHQPEPARQAYTKARAIGVGREDLASYVDQRLRALE